MTRDDIKKSDFERRKRNRWVTDAIFCLDVRMMIVANSTRSVIFYDVTSLQHVPMFLVLSTPNIVEVRNNRP